MSELLEIDGSVLEGGGQILRNAISLSAILGIPVKVTKIRAGRSKPGLAAQHLKGIELVAEMCNAKLSGASIGSTEIQFTPGKILGGQYVADTKTAGSISLLLQVALPCAFFASGDVKFELRGGTNADMAPQIDYMTEVFAYVLRRFNANFQLTVHRRGYFPKGGGRVTVDVKPVVKLPGVELTERGEISTIQGWSFVAGNLPVNMAHDMADAAQRELPNYEINIDSYKENRDHAPDNCNGIILVCESSSGCVLGSDGLGKRTVSPRDVGARAGEALCKELDSGACVDTHSQMAHDMADAAQRELPNYEINIDSYKENRDHAPDNCNGIILVCESSSGCVLGSDGLGKRTVSPRDVGARAGEALCKELDSGACVDTHSQDQMIIYMALAEGRSIVRTGEVTLHTRTAIHIAELMAKIKFTVQPDGNQNLISCTGLGIVNTT